MDLTLSSEERQIRRAARELAEAHFAEDAFSHFGEIPEENAKVLADHGYLGMTLPEKYGGSDASYFEAMLAMEGVGAVCPETAAFMGSTNIGNVQIISEFAENKYKEKYLPPITAGEILEPTATAMSEPEAGSAVTDIRTSAIDDGDDYIVNGQKIWVSGAPSASVFNTYVRFPDGNVGTLLIEPDTPGFNIQDPMINMAGGEQSQIFIDDARVSKDRELVVGPDSFKQAMYFYNVNRVFSQASKWTMAKWIFEEALDYAQQRKTWGTPIAEYQAVSHRLVDMATKLETSRWLIYRALSGDDLPGRAISCMAKTHASENLHEVVDAALQIKGANGYVGETPESYAYRQLRGGLIASGTSDINRNNVAKSLFKSGYPEIE